MATHKQMRIEAKKALSHDALMACAVIGGKKETRQLAMSGAWAQLAKDFKGEGRHHPAAVIAAVRDVCGLEGPSYNPLFAGINTLGVKGCTAIARAVEGYKARADEVQCAKIQKLRDKGDSASAELESTKLSQGIHCRKQTEAVTEWYARMGNILDGLAARYQLVEDEEAERAAAGAAQRELQAETALAAKGKPVAGQLDHVAFVRHIWGLSNVASAELSEDKSSMAVVVKNLKRTQGKDKQEHKRVKRILGLSELTVTEVASAPAEGSKALAQAFSAFDAAKVATTAAHMAAGAKVLDPEESLL